MTRRIVDDKHLPKPFTEEIHRRKMMALDRLPKPRTEESVRDELRGVARLVQIIERVSI